MKPTRRHYIVKQYRAAAAHAAPVAIIHKDPVHDTVGQAWKECLDLNGLVPCLPSGSTQFFWVLTTDKSLISGDAVRPIDVE